MPGERCVVMAEPGQKSLRVGRLLVASPLLPDPNFDRTVVLVIAYGDEGALGLVLNRPSQMKVAEPLPRWQHLAAEPAVLFLGGPVQHQAVICLARHIDPGQTAGQPGPYRLVTPGVGTLDLDGDPSEVSGRVSRIRMFAGYAGWSPGQLEGEIEAGAWWIVDARPDDPFSEDPEQLWKAVLRRQRPPLTFVAYFPDDPTEN